MNMDQCRAEARDRERENREEHGRMWSKLSRHDVELARISTRLALIVGAVSAALSLAGQLLIAWYTR